MDARPCVVRMQMLTCDIADEVEDGDDEEDLDDEEDEDESEEEDGPGLADLYNNTDLQVGQVLPQKHLFDFVQSLHLIKFHRSLTIEIKNVNE